MSDSEDRRSTKKYDTMHRCFNSGTNKGIGPTEQIEPAYIETIDTKADGRGLTTGRSSGPQDDDRRCIAHFVILS